MADSTPKSYSSDPTLWLYTSLTAGSSQIITATARLEGILKANKVPFQALDVATDEKARMLWGRRAGKRKLPGLVRQGMIVGVCLPLHFTRVFQTRPQPRHRYSLAWDLGMSKYTSADRTCSRTTPRSRNGTSLAKSDRTSPPSQERRLLRPQPQTPLPKPLQPLTHPPHRSLPHLLSRLPLPRQATPIRL